MTVNPKRIQILQAGNGRPYMSCNGCRSKFDVNGYIDKVRKEGTLLA